VCVRWYLRYALSYRDLEELMLERGVQVDHTTIYRSRAVLRPRVGEALSASSEGHE
jgi:transposase-like protein